MSTQRSSALPDVPTTVELGFPALQSSTWFALLAPRGTPVPILDRLNADVNEILDMPDVRKRLEGAGMDMFVLNAKQMHVLVRSDLTKLAAIAKAANIKAE